MDDLLGGLEHHILASAGGARCFLGFTGTITVVTLVVTGLVSRTTQSHQHSHHFHGEPQVLHVIVRSKGDCAVQEGLQRAFSDEGIPLGAATFVLRVGGVLERCIVAQAQVPERPDDRSHIVVRGESTVGSSLTTLLFLHEDEVLESLHLARGTRVLAATAAFDANVLDDVAPGEQCLDVGCPVRHEVPDGLDARPHAGDDEVLPSAVLSVPCLVVATTDQRIPHEDREVVRRGGDDDLRVFPMREVFVANKDQGTDCIFRQRSAGVVLGPLAEGSGELTGRPLVLVVEVRAHRAHGAHTCTQHSVHSGLVGGTVLGS